MKKTAILIILALTVISEMSAQDVIDQSAIKINNKVSLGATKQIILTEIGLPDSQVVEFAEMSNSQILKMKYNASVLYLSGERLESFRISDDSIFIQYNSTIVRVGNAVSALSRVFPDSYAERFNHHADGLVLHLNEMIQGQSKKLDRFLEIRFSRATGLITEINYAFY